MEGDPFNVTFLDQQVNALYEEDRQIGRLMSAFVGLAIIIACLGLFGLAAFAAEQRQKEIGIRKVFGASVSSIAVHFGKEFIILVLLAFVVAAPISYFVLNRWLDSFVYRIEIGPGVLILAALGALLVAMLTVSYQAIRAAVSNPIESLKYE